MFFWRISPAAVEGIRNCYDFKLPHWSLDFMRYELADYEWTAIRDMMRPHDSLKRVRRPHMCLPGLIGSRHRSDHARPSSSSSMYRGGSTNLTVILTSSGVSGAPVSFASMALILGCK